MFDFGDNEQAEGNSSDVSPAEVMALEVPPKAPRGEELDLLGTSNSREDKSSSRWALIPTFLSAGRLTQNLQLAAVTVKSGGCTLRFPHSCVPGQRILPGTHGY